MVVVGCTGSGWMGRVGVGCTVSGRDTQGRGGMHRIGV